MEKEAFTVHGLAPHIGGLSINQDIDVSGIPDGQKPAALARKIEELTGRDQPGTDGLRIAY